MTGTKAALSANTADDITAEIRREVAQAMFEAGAGDDESWAGLPEEDRADITHLAGLAIDAYRAWLTKRGYRMTPPGTFTGPSCEQEGLAMLAAAQGYLSSIKRRRKLMATPGLIVPGAKH